MTVEQLPAFNAAMNGMCTLLLIGGWVLIRRGHWRGHAWAMSMAFVFSALFLVGYVTRIVVLGEKTSGLQPGTLRTVYFAILAPHVILAMVMVPMIIMVFLRAYWRQWDRHRRLARWTMPIWLYVSMTGVIIYWMLYHLFPTIQA